MTMNAAFHANLPSQLPVSARHAASRTVARLRFCLPLICLPLLLIGGCSRQNEQAEQLVRTALKQQQAGEHQDAVRTLTRSLALNPEFAEAYYLRGTCYAVMEDLPSAIADLEAARQKKPTWDRAWWALGTAYRSVNRQDEALQALNKALELNPKAADAAYDRACLLQDLGQREAAIADFRQAAELNPSNAAALSKCGVLEAEIDPYRALDTLSAALQIDRHNADTWLQRGLVYAMSGATDRALGDLSVACRLSPENAAAWTARGRVLRKLNRPREAIEDLTRALALSPEDSLLQNDLKLAQRDLDKASKIATAATASSEPNTTTASSSRTSALSMSEVIDDLRDNPADAASATSTPAANEAFAEFPLDGSPIPDPVKPPIRATPPPAGGFATFGEEDANELVVQSQGSGPGDSQDAESNTQAAEMTAEPFVAPETAAQPEPAELVTLPNDNPFQLQLESAAPNADAKATAEPVDADGALMAIVVPETLPETLPESVPAPDFAADTPDTEPGDQLADEVEAAAANPFALPLPNTDVAKTPSAASPFEELPAGESGFAATENSTSESATTTTQKTEPEAVPDPFAIATTVETVRPLPPVEDVQETVDAGTANTPDSPSTAADSPNSEQSNPFQSETSDAQMADSSVAGKIRLPDSDSDTNSPEKNGPLRAATPLQSLNSDELAMGPEPSMEEIGVLYKRAVAAHRRADRTACVAAFDLLLKAAPNDQSARFAYAEALLDFGDAQESLAILTPLISADADNAEYVRLQALLLTRLKRYPAAITAYTRLMTLGQYQEEALTERARIHLASEQWPDAVKDLSELLRADPNNTVLLTQRARAQEKAQQYTLAIADWTQLHLLDASNAKFLEARANAFLRIGEDSAAISDLAEILRTRPEDSRVTQRLIQLHSELGQWQQVDVLSEKMLQMGEGDTTLRFLRARALRQLDDKETSTHELNALLAMEPDHWEALLLRAELASERGEFREALADLNQAVRLRPHDEDVLRLRAIAHSESGDRTAALADLTKLLRQQPDSIPTLLKRAELFHRIGDDEGAAADAEAILELEPKHYQARVIRGNARFAESRYADALEDYNVALETQPQTTDVELLWRRCQCRRSKQQDILAVTDLDRILELNPTHSAALLERARLKEAGGAFESAVQDLSVVIQNQPDAAEAWAWRGTIHHRMGRFQEAIHDLDRAILLNSDVPENYYRRGLAHHQLQNPPQAMEDLNQALQRDPNNADFLYSRGNVHASEGALKQATADYQAAVENNPKHSAAWYNQGNMLFSQNDFDGAVRCWGKAIEIQPDLFRAYNNRAAAYVQLKQYGAAIADYDQTLELNPGFARAYDNYAWLLATAEEARFRDPRRAVSLAQKACDLTDNQNWSHLSTLAAAYAEAGDFVSARKWLVESHKLAPENQKQQLVKLVKLYETEINKRHALRDNPEQPRRRL